MFRILIVEDDETVLEDLCTALAESFPTSVLDDGALIHRAMNVAQARSLIDKAYHNKKHYHAVILDFLLPEKLGSSTEKIDESLCILLRAIMPLTLVAHITGNPEDIPIREHLRRVHEEDIDPRSFALSKTDVQFMTKLTSKLRSFLYGWRVEDQIDALFGRYEMHAFAGRARAAHTLPRGERSLTHELAALCRDIEAYWVYLDDRLKGRITDIFHVDSVTDAGDPSAIRVSLLQRPGQDVGYVNTTSGVSSNPSSET